jgi:hypothetical protein
MLQAAVCDGCTLDAWSSCVVANSGTFKDTGGGIRGTCALVRFQMWKLKRRFGTLLHTKSPVPLERIAKAFFGHRWDQHSFKSLAVSRAP